MERDDAVKGFVVDGGGGVYGDGGGVVVGFVKGDAELVFGGFGGVFEGGFKESVNGKFVGVKVLHGAAASFHGGGGANGGLVSDDAIGDGDGVGLRVKDGLDFEDGNAVAADVFGLPLRLFGGDEEVGFGGSGDGESARDEKNKNK